MIVGDWTSAEVRALRDALLKTQEEFAETLGYSVQAVQKWEYLPAGRKLGRRKTVEDLESLFGRLDPTQRERFQSALARSYFGPTVAELAVELHSKEVVDDVKRREFGKAIAGALVAGTLHIDVGDAHRVSAYVNLVEDEARRVGGASLVRTVLHQTDRALRALDVASFGNSKAEATYASAVGHLAATASWLAFDSTLVNQAKRSVNEAFTVANQVRDDDVTVHACMALSLETLALAKTGEGSPQHALRLTGLARNLLRGRPPARIHALVATREAQAYAQIGDREKFVRAISTAWREMEQAADYEPIEQCPVWLQFVSRSEVRFHEARGYARLGETTAAVEIFSDMERGAGRNAAFYRAGKAATLAGGGDIAAAVTEGTLVLDELENDLRSPRTIKFLEPVRSAADQLPAAEEFCRRFDAVASTVKV
ncbi:helix-turn-helix domain-containing protein [Nocardia sp. NPDC059246]|uniref:helix-turn-helix domain-containing protein n=1 Tax=unclassified Nocardia TaxID=2637762 RepID=UPI00368A2EB6